MSSTFKSKFNYKLYFLVLLFLPFLLVLFAGLSTLVENIKSGSYFNEFGLTVIMPAVIIALTYYSFRFYITKSPKVEIDEREIRIGDNSISFSEIDKIRVRSKHNTYFLIMPYHYSEASSIILKNGKEYVLYVEHYLNGNLIRVNLNNLNKYLGGQTSYFKVSTSAVSQKQPQQFYKEDFHEYRQPPYKFANYYIFFPFIMFLIYFVFSFDAPVILRSIFLGIALLFYSILVRQSHYFLVSEDVLIVKNYLFPWWKRSFPTNSIYQATTEHQPKQELALKIITTDFRIYRYQSGLMNDSMFRDLISGLKVRRRVLHQTI
ncbi:hypothetical protein [Pontibacter cellulosilyticus]|uniref:Uncharacterized protein n=1 Tax=Pontibacter cellulosilyticus TaxID=1720253 RepID=A0A923N869_9BACT|nr:hypothetical protein [Pontibacter cellulosilyticus]MBC5992657.1 hypothetical protein [Pontibacter cellulosilyticus]